MFFEELFIKKKTFNFFSIVIDACNQEQWIKKCLDSCLSQKFENYEVIFMDAMSNDRTFDIAMEYVSKFPKLSVYQNQIRLPQIANILELTKLSRPGSIVVSVDGDDWLPNKKILQKLDKVYSSGETWMTYGTYKEYPSRSVSHIYKAYPDEVIDTNAFREYRWLASHLRTYRRELFLKINEKDFKREDGNWLDTAGDMAFMIPMLEMSGHRSKYIKDTMYVYNVADMQRDGNVNEKRQMELADYVRVKKKYNLLGSL